MDDNAANTPTPRRRSTQPPDTALEIIPAPPPDDDFGPEIEQAPAPFVPAKPTIVRAKELTEKTLAEMQAGRDALNKRYAGYRSE